MTLSSSNNRWLKSTLIAGGLLLIVGVWAHVAGGIFLMAHQHGFEEARPWTLYQYWLYYGADKRVERWLLISAGLSALIVLTPSLLFFAPAKRSLFGDARFAKASEVRRAGLLGAKGIIVGLYRGKYLMFGGSQHVIMSAPTRGGKGVGIVIPNLLTWPDSVVVLDVKQENHGITSAYRERHGQPCYLFNPAATDYRTHRYNPLAYLSDDPNFRIDDAQKIGNMLFPDQLGTDVIWTATPRSLFLGITLMLCETPGKLVTIGQVLRESLTDGDGAKYFADIINTRALGERIKDTPDAEAEALAFADVTTVLSDRGKAPDHHPRIAEMAIWAHVSAAYKRALVDASVKLAKLDRSKPNIASVVTAAPIDRLSAGVGKALSPACVRGLNTYVSIASDNTRAGVMTSFRSRLELWSNPLVDAATSSNDFDLRNLRKKRMSIFLGVTPDNLDRMAPLLNLFFQQLIDLNTRELPERNPELKYQCLLLADEFTAMGKVAVLSRGISYIAGYGLRMLPIIQSPAQVVDVYGKEAAQTFTTNHALQIVFPPKASELETARNISEWLGYQTVKGVSESKAKGLFRKKAPTESASDQRRALLLPQEITSLGKEAELVVVEDCPPILATKIRYFSDPTFVDRLKSVSPTLRALGKKMPDQKQLHAAVVKGELAAPVPLIDVEAHQAHIAAMSSPVVVVAPGASKIATVTVQRAAIADDLPKLGGLALADFAVDFSGIEPPAAGVMDEGVLQAYADSLCRRAGINVE